MWTSLHRLEDALRLSYLYINSCYAGLCAYAHAGTGELHQTWAAIVVKLA